MRRLVSILVVLAYPSLLMMWFRMRQTTAFASVELVVYPLVFGGIGIGVIFLLKRYLLAGNLSELNSGRGRLVTDVLWGLVLAALCFALFFIARHTLQDLLASTPNLELLGLMLDMRESPVLLVLWFGPVLWIGISLFEELMRTFLLNELWTFSRNRVWIAASILVAAVFMGLLHWSQGPYGVVTIAIKSAVIGAFYFRIRRLLPLVLAHVLYDGLQVGALLLTYPAN